MKNGLVTLNDRGYMTWGIDPFTQKFLDHCESHSGAHIFEGGAAYGIATHLALKRGAIITANDGDPRHLDLLHEHPPVALHLNCLLVCSPMTLIF